MNRMFKNAARKLTANGDRYVAPLSRHFLQSLCLLMSLLPATAAAEEGNSHAYRLAPGDRITVTVFGQPELSGDLLIDDAGTVAVPLTTVPTEVKDMTVTEAQERIGDRLLADRLLHAPSVSVRIGELRPLYVLGDVRLPGAYPFRYGSTTQSAVALAGGFGPGEVLRRTAVSEYLQAQERVHQLTLQKHTLLLRKARLEAQRDGKTSFTPPDFGDSAGKDIAEIVANEQDIFNTQAAVLRDQIDLLRSQKPLLRRQIEANNEQGAAGKKQLDLIRQQIDRYGNLLKQGLGTQNNDFQYRVLEANQEASVWRQLSDVSRLEVESGNLDFKIEEVEAAFKRQVLVELQQNRDHLGELEISLPAAIQLRNVKLQYAGGAATRDVRHSISITRMRNGRAVVLDADERTPVEPGDVIDVKNEMSGVMPHDEAAAPPPTSRSSSTEQAHDLENGDSISR
jgi:polysaccharide biosynthesis/export protein